MVNSMPTRFFALCLLFAFACWNDVAYAARTFTVTQSPANGTALPMGSTQTLSYQITSSMLNGGDVGRCLYKVQLTTNGTYSTLLGSTAGPAGWTRTKISATSVTFQVSSLASALAVGGSASFNLAMAMVAASADLSATLTSVRAFYTNTACSATTNTKTTLNNPGSWLLKSLAITAFQITDTSGIPITAQAAGNIFQLRMTVKNNSSVAQNPVVSNANAPAGTWTGTGASPNCTAGGSLSLAAGASGTIIFSCSSVATAKGTIFFTAIAQRGGTVTSASAISTTLAISTFIANLGTSSATCLYAGSTLTMIMTISNNTGSTITGINGTLTPIAGAPVNYVSGPTPASIASMATATSATMTWVFTINSTGTTNPFSFNGFATGTSGVLLTTPTAVYSPLKRGVFAVTANPASTNAASSNTELTFNVTNNGCANVNSVAVTAPVGWTFGGDAYSLVTLAAGSTIETWTTGGGTFTAPNVAGQMPLGFDGDFSLVYTATPSAATTSVFTLRVTDATGAFTDVPLNVPVNAFSAPLNDAKNKLWREDFK